MILGKGEPLIGRLLYFDALKMSFREFKIQKNKDCPVCGENPTVRELIDYEGFCGITPERTRMEEELQVTPEEVQERIAPRGKQRVPEGKIDYQTALRVAENIAEPERQRAVVEHIVEERLPQRVAAEVIRRVAAEPRGEVVQVAEQATRETQPIMSFNHRHYKAVMAGKKSQTTRRRLDPGLKEGVTVRAAVTHFADLAIERVERKRLRDITAEDAEREGGYTLEQFKERWVRVYGGWSPDELVYVVQFKPLRFL